MQKKVIPVECWTRCVGYFRNIDAMHIGKQEEVKHRKLYDVKKFAESLKK